VDATIRLRVWEIVPVLLVEVILQACALSFATFGPPLVVRSRLQEASMKNRQFRLKQRPTGRAKSTDFDLVEFKGRLRC
jgi:hypothetical protein